MLGEGGALAMEAVVVAEHAKGAEMPERAGVLRMKKQYKYGDTMLTLYIKEHAE